MRSSRSQKSKTDPFLKMWNACTDGEDVPSLILTSLSTLRYVAHKYGVAIPVYGEDGKLVKVINKLRRRKKK